MAIVGYFMWFHKDKTLKFIPENADFVVMIDVKKTSQQYVFSLVKHPSLWFGDSKLTFKNNGIKVPDFIQIFHLKETDFSEWYSIFEISDKDDFQKYLKAKGFKLTKNNIYSKDQFSIKIAGSKCIVGFSNKDFENSISKFLNSEDYKKLNADQLINNSIGSLSHLSGSQIWNFSIDLNDDDIEIKNISDQNRFSSIISDLEKKVSFLKLKLDSKNIQKVSRLFNKKLNDSLKIKSVFAVSELELVNDKIISYGYDDNFNEVEKVSYQKIVQPNYAINLQSSEPIKIWDYFKNKKWINAQNQFTLIPFQPNAISQNGNEISITSTRKPIRLEKNRAGNFVFIRNSSFLNNSLKTLSKTEKKLISNLEYVFYGNLSENYYLKLKFKKGDLPIILR